MDGKGRLSSSRKRSIAAEGAEGVEGQEEQEAQAVLRVKAEEKKEDVRLGSALEGARMDGPACQACLWRGEADGCHAADCKKHAMNGGCDEQHRTRLAESLVGFHARAHARTHARAHARTHKC